MGSTHSVPPTLGLPRTGVSVLSPSTLLRLPAALCGVGPVLSAVPVFGRRFGCACVLCLPRPQRPRQPWAWAHFPRCGVPFPSAAPARAAGRSQEVFRQDPGPVCQVGGGGFSGAEFAPFPSPLPPTSSRVGAALLWKFLSPFVLRTAGGVFRPVNFSLLSTV